MIAVLHGALLGLAGFGAAAHLAVHFGTSFHEEWLFVTLVLGGIWAAWQQRRTAAQYPAPVAPTRWQVVVLLSVLAILAAVIAYGATRTPARHWDGYATWELKALYLADLPSLDQPFFRDPHAYHPSRDYPLLQPLLWSAMQRLVGNGGWLFAGLYLVLALSVWVGLRTVQPWLRVAGTMATAITPLLVQPSQGGADSGYAELLLLTCLTAAGAGMALRHWQLLACSTFCMVLAKPEGLVYGGVLMLALLWRREGLAEGRAVVIGWLAAASLWLPLQRDLLFLDRPSLLAFLVAACVVGLIAVVLDLLLLRLQWRRRRFVLLGSVAALTLCLPWIGSTGGTASTYLGDMQRLWERLPLLPEIILGALEKMVAARRFGLLFVMLAWLAVWPRRPSNSYPVAVPESLRQCLILGLCTLPLPFLLSPESNLQHHLESSMGRLLLHWTGIGWLVVCHCTAGRFRQRDDVRMTQDTKLTNDTVIDGSVSAR